MTHKHGFHIALEGETVHNSDYRRVLYTGAHSQLVLMSLIVGEEIGLETHPGNDQFFRFESGTGLVSIDETEYEVVAGDAVIIPAGAKHNVKNTSTTEVLKMYTIYSPAHHKDKVVRHTKTEAEADSPEFDGVLSE